jgi:hypothetical protein
LIPNRVLKNLILALAYDWELREIQ